jgi:dTDP-glucose 4,6-dehydratase
MAARNLSNVMKYLVLGSSSFYGKSFLKFLHEKGEDAQGLARPEFDLRKDFRLPQADVIVNFIAESLVAESWEDPERWLQTNIVLTNRLFEEIRKKEVSLYIHIGTPEVYGSNTSWIKERRDYLPTTPYAVSRASADMLLYTYWKAYRFPMIITRTANIYGPGQQPFRLIPKAFSLLGEGEKFPIHGTGKSQRSFIHVLDACKALWILSREGQVGETYHISTQKTHSILEVVRMIIRILGKGEVEFKMDRLGKDHAYLLNSDKMRKLGWYDHIELEQGLKDYANNGNFVEDSRRIPLQA